MRLPIYQIDAFTDVQFGGNPAAVMPLDAWLPDMLMQRIAQENNLSETVFFVPSGEAYAVRWFTPATEVKLCGHATLAAAFVIFSYLRPELSEIRFSSLSGMLTVRRVGDRLSMDFPAWPHTRMEAPPALVDALGAAPLEFYDGEYQMAVLADEAAVRAVAPDMHALTTHMQTGLIVTAPGDGVDFVSRSFFPCWDVGEDPVTGSSHCMLTPYWAKRLGKIALQARQISARGGALDCRLEGERVLLSGQAVPYLQGEITLR